MVDCDQAETLMTISTISFVYPLLIMGAKFLSLATSAMTASSVSWNATPFNPASVPLAVRTPYLSAWLPQGAATALNGAWPQFWTGSVGFFSTYTFEH